MRYLEWLYGMFAVYEEKSIQEAYDFATDNQIRVEGSLAGMLYYRVLLLCELNKKETALELFKEAVVKHECWYPKSALLNASIVKTFGEDDSFEGLVKMCESREATYRYNGKPTIKIFEPKKQYLNNPKLLIALHGDQQEIEAVHDYWNPEQFFNHVVAIPEASELAFTDGHTWSDVNRGIIELTKHYQDLTRKYGFTKKDITICAFSSGTNVAFEALIKGAIEVDNLIVVGPPLSKLEELKDNLKIFKEQEISTYILCGEQDTRFLPVAKSFAKQLNEIEANCKLHISKNTNHEYPEDFEVVLKDIKGFLKL